MAIIRKLFDFFIFSSLYISLCAVVMVWQTGYLLIQSTLPLTFYGFVFFATMCSYNFHWWLTPHSVGYSQRIHWAQEHKGWHFFMYLVGLAGSAICFFSILQHWLALAFAALLTFLYSAPKIPQDFFRALKRIAIGKTLFLAFVWTYVTSLLPVFIAHERPGAAVWLFTLGRFGLIYAICILFDYRDREDDRKEGIKSMITYFNERGIHFLFVLSLAIFLVTTIALSRYGFSAGNLFIILVPGIILLLLYGHAKRNSSDYLYYFVLDGLMMFSGLLMLIIRI